MYIHVEKSKHKVNNIIIIYNVSIKSTEQIKTDKSGFF